MRDSRDIGIPDMLILKIVALGPAHGYAIAERIQQISLTIGDFRLTIADWREKPQTSKTEVCATRLMADC
jgi:DNA-binding PadR family transcriptional regulator